MNTALVIVDVQEDFLSPHGALAVSRGRDIIPGIKKLLRQRWACVAASMDWHPPNHCSFASQQHAPFSEKVFTHPENARDRAGNVITKTSHIWPEHCVQDTPGAEVEASLREALDSVNARYIHKGMLEDREYYSAFGDIWGLHQTELERFLRENGAEAVVFVGIAYDYCVLNSAVDCARLGFRTSVLKDLCRSVDASADATTDALYSHAGVAVTTSDLYQK